MNYCGKVHELQICDLKNTIPEIKKIIETFYEIGTVKDVKKLEIGETNGNYYLFVEKDGKDVKYFGQLFSAAKTFKDLKYEIALRNYFMETKMGMLRCALCLPTKDEGFTVKCDCIETGQTRYFCVFEFIEGITYDYDQWAFGEMDKKMIDGLASGIARYHMTASGYEPPDDCGDVMISYADELKEYRRVFTEEFEKRKTPMGENAFYDSFGKYQPRLLELLEKYTDHYMDKKDELIHCICHMDTSGNNYIFGDNFQPIAVCDMDWSHIMPRLFDLCWLTTQSFFHYDVETPSVSLILEDIAELLNAYDAEMEKAGNIFPGKLTALEREMFPEMFQLVAMRLGLYNILAYIMTNNPTATVEYNLYWSNCAIAEIECVEEHMDEIRQALRI